MQRTKLVCFYCLHKFWLALAVTLVLLAVLISVLRYTLPHADSYKHHIEQLISSRYGADVSIGELSAGWQKYGPALLLRDVKLLDSSGQLQLSISETRVRLDFWRSLSNWQLTAQHFELSGLQYYIDADSLLSSEGATALDSAPVFAALEQLFFQQLTYFSVVDSQLILQNDHNPDLVVDIKQLDWANRGNRHQGYGDLALAGVTANTVSFILDLHGDTLEDVSGQLYLESDKLDVLPWFRTLLPPSQKLQQASINFKAWGKVDNGLLQRIQVELADNSVSWHRGDTAHSLQLGPGQLLWQPAADGWVLHSGPLTLSDQQQQWQGLQFQLQRSEQQWLGQVNNFSLNAITPLANLLADDISILQQLVAYQPAGDIQQLQWRFADQQWQLQGRLDNVSSLAQGDIPGVSNMRGDFIATPTLARIQLESLGGELSWDGLFSEATAYDVLSARVYLHNVAGNWQLSIPQLSMHNADLQLDASIKLADELSILARLQQLDASRAAHYFPQRYMPQSVRDYLSDAIISGRVNNATMLWQGKPAEFPYTEQQGVFQVLTQLDQGRFAFAPDWPQIENLSAQLWFENAAMTIQSAAGSLNGIELEQGVSAVIPDLFDAQTLDIHIQRQVQASAVTELMLQSPLHDSLGKTLQHLGVQGLADGDVTLAVGLKQTAVQASGTVSFTDASLNLQAPAMQVQQLTGSLSFANEKIRADQLQLSWRGLPVTAALQGENTADGYQLALQLNGGQNSQQLLQALHAPAASLVAGTTDWQLQLALNLAADDINYQAQLRSNLHNTALLLPAPYTKAEDETAELTLTVTGNSAQSAIALGYIQQNDAQQLHFNALLQHDTQQLRRAHLSLGQQEPVPAADEFTISINLPELDFLAWFDLIKQQLDASASDTEQHFFPRLAQVRGKVAQLDVAPGVRLHNTVFDAEQLPQHWQLQLNGTELASRWQFNKDWQQQGIVAAFDYLHLPLSETVSASEQAAKVTEKLALTAQRWLLELPPLTVSCADCSIGNYRFGQVEAQAHSSAERWELTKLNARYKRHQLNVQGFWQDDGSAGYSEFTGQLQSPNIGAMLAEFQLTSAIAGSNADIKFALNWPGAPNQYAVADLSGNVSYTLGEGSLTEVSDQGSRLFSIFSLDSLVRKLRLDFRDVFAKGFFYNKMSGNLAIAKGVAQTSDASIDGVPGNLQIQGYADLVSKQLDYQMAFSPKVTSSLPVIIAWMVNPATGLAALALDEVFQSAEVISKINFTVTGSFEQPVVTEVNRHSTEIPVPVRIAQPEAIIQLPAATQPDPERNKPHG
ncbi:MAG: TIGR02099 family protein [Gammaproteobacteria bacterium HGW-Gammaproteobacteria-15]|nr:MAG: TIGR02099 family protein [Gammaproteobacteria bacterium HGW-Gammaproteobacteria-15]